ncbi:hypothetical protein I79_015533 [Cricetulus griseus]|uniref:Uncharacterized protein n=1 Tax=Cricetulus griseus TaxID=10029 RepID=G3HX18_CRIGR|nr:hypothetical protein I79_015533 [Cricetulus griseus]
MDRSFIEKFHNCLPFASSTCGTRNVSFLSQASVHLVSEHPRGRGEDLRFEASLGYTVSLRPA